MKKKNKTRLKVNDLVGHVYLPEKPIGKIQKISKGGRIARINNCRFAVENLVRIDLDQT
jgi:hypothetical protein